MSKEPITVKRETWVPPEARNIEAMKLNLGDKPENSFVWFPKGTLRTDDGFELHYMDIPVGTQLYKGMGGAVGHPKVPCQKVVNPSTLVTEKKYPSWFSDYTTSLIYANNNPKFIYAFETTVPIRLVNLMDKRNLDIIYQRLIKNLKSEDENAMFEAQDDLYTLDMVTRYPMPDEDVKAIVSSPRKKDNLVGQGFVDTEVIPPEMIAELGDQKALSRYSFSRYDKDVIDLLYRMFSTIGIHGYYAPTYYSDFHTVPGGAYGFLREVCLFSMKGMVFHNKTSPYDGCMVKGGKKHVRSNRHKTHRNQSRNRKHRQHTRKLIF